MTGKVVHGYVCCQILLGLIVGKSVHLPIITCAHLEENKLVTSARIAKKYEKFIFANPCWKLGHMLQTVQEEMFANVSMSKLKRAKALVMKKAFDATKGQYSRLCEY